jgi:choline dehydrogenase-like flavoprotein
MMSQELGAVVNERLLVYDTSNLRVVDASVFPLEPRGNTQTSAYAVAERAVDIIKVSIRAKKAA